MSIKWELSTIISQSLRERVRVQVTVGLGFVILRITVGLSGLLWVGAFGGASSFGLVQNGELRLGV